MQTAFASFTQFVTFSLANMDYMYLFPVVLTNMQLLEQIKIRPLELNLWSKSNSNFHPGTVYCRGSYLDPSKGNVVLYLYNQQVYSENWRAR